MPNPATEMPKSSCAVVSEPFSSATCSQSAAVLVNTYARPNFLALPDEPIKAVVPDMATEVPKKSPAVVSEPFSSATCFHPAAVLVNT